MTAVRIIAAAVIVVAAAAQAQAAKTLRFWNLTAATITELYVAPAGTQSWSANLCLSDPDHNVEADERLNLPGVSPGTFDVRVVDAERRMCTLKGVTLKADGAYAFSISESEMKGCSK